METPDRRAILDLKEALGQRAEDVDFFQLVRWAERRARAVLLEEYRRRIAQDGPEAAATRIESVGTGAEPEREVVRFQVRPTLRFPGNAVHRARVTLSTDSSGEVLEGLRWDVDVAFVGLVGPQGVLPQHYSELLLERAQSKDTALRDLLDLLHQRLISFFYRAWRKHHLAAAIEAEEGAERQPLGSALCALAGSGLEGHVEASGLPREAAQVFAGHLARDVTPVSVLEQLLAGALGTEVEIESFVGRWAPLRPEDRGVLGRRPDGAGSPGLGQGFVLGAECFDVTSRARVRLGPMPFDEVERYRGDRPVLGRARALFERGAGPVIEPEFELVVERDGAHGVSLGGPESGGGGLGWSAWLLDELHPEAPTLTARLGVPDRIERL